MVTEHEPEKTFLKSDPLKQSILSPTNESDYNSSNISKKKQCGVENFFSQKFDDNQSCDLGYSYFQNDLDGDNVPSPKLNDYNFG